LVKKLGIREGDRVLAVGAPEHLGELLRDLPDGARLVTRAAKGARYPIVVWFVTAQRALDQRFGGVRRMLEPSGGLWVAWPKRASGVKTDVTEDTVRATALAGGLVDNKVCAIDETWSGLRLVVRLADRPKERVAPARTRRTTAIAVPDDFAHALSRSAAAKEAFDAMPSSHKRRWIDWIGQAKRPETRARRVAKATREIAAG
jgi:hypothetical protein